MKFIACILKNYPEVKIGILIGKELKIENSNPGLDHVKADALIMAQEKIGCQPVTRHPYIASWRDLYRSFGTKPADYRPSAEALIRRALKEGGLPVINTAVDAYNAVSVRYITPMGGFDLDKLKGNIHLRYSNGGEEFTPLGSKVLETTYKGEVVYADDTQILTRRWNYRDCDETKITTMTRNVIMFIDGSCETPKKTVEEMLDHLKNLLKLYCGGDYIVSMASRESDILEF